MSALAMSVFIDESSLAAVCQMPRTPFDHISAMIWSGARGTIARTVL